jgi:hypothetical protein
MPLTALGGTSGTVVIGDTTTAVFPQTLHPSVNAYIAAQRSVGYIMTRVEIDAVNNLVLAMVANDLWDKMQVIYPCIGNNAASFKWNLKDTTTFNITFQGSWVYASTGMQVAAASTANRGLTGYTPSVHQTLDNAHISVYVRNFYTAGTNGSIFGAYNQFGGGGTMIGISAQVAGSTDSWCINIGSMSGRTSLSGYTGGMFTVSRLTASGYASNVLNNNARSTVLPGTSGTRVPSEIWIGTAQGSTACQPQEIAFATIGLGLNQRNVINLYNIVQSFQTALGRQV